MSVSKSTPLYEAPADVLCWRAHITTVVSIDLAEDKALIITASTDCLFDYGQCRAGILVSEIIVMSMEKLAVSEFRDILRQLGSYAIP